MKRFQFPQPPTDRWICQYGMKLDHTLEELVFAYASK